MKVRATIKSGDSTEPRLRGPKNVAMVCGFPSAVSRQPVRGGVHVEHHPGRIERCSRGT